LSLGLKGLKDLTPLEFFPRPLTGCAGFAAGAILDRVQDCYDLVDNTGDGCAQFW